MRIVRSHTLAPLFALSVAAACRDEPRPPAAPPRVARQTVPAAAAPSAPVMTWDSSAGPALLLATDASPDSVEVVLPSAGEDVQEASATNVPGRTPSIAGTTVDLFGRSGLMGRGTLGGNPVGRTRAGCTQWPRTRIAGATSGWRVALIAGRATGIPLDSLRGLPADSMQLAAEVSRLAAATPAGRDTTFAGVPFVVRSVYRFPLGGGEALVASLRRGIPSEANPREEQTLLIAERQPGDSAYRVVFTRRSSGADEPAQVTDPLAVLMLRASRRAAIIVSKEREEGGSVGLIERIRPGEWRETWHSGYVGC